MPKTILLIEDEAQIARTLRLYLERAGFRTMWAADGPQGLKLFRQEKPALVLLDLNLPGGMDGLDVCRTLCRESHVPVIMLTARQDEMDKLLGLELGADDYITKPFSPREVVARVRAVLRRVGESGAPSEMLQVGDMQLDIAGRTASVKGDPIALTRREFDLLAALMRYPGRVFTREQLLEQIIGIPYGNPYFESDERTVDQHIKNLRQKIEPDPKHPCYILTVRGVGYKMARE